MDKEETLKQMKRLGMHLSEKTYMFNGEKITPVINDKQGVFGLPLYIAEKNGKFRLLDEREAIAFIMYIKESKEL